MRPTSCYARPMATKTVCDFCGEDATGTRVVDVCGSHGPEPVSNGKVRRRKLAACEVCGKKVSVGAGMAAHMRSHQ